MKKLKIIFILLIIFIGTFLIFSNFSQKNDKKITNSPTGSNIPDFEKRADDKNDIGNMSEEKTTSLTKDTLSDRYVQYSPEIYNSTANTRRVLFFYANWCPFCKSAHDSFIENISQIPEDVTIIRVNYNDSDTDKEEKSLAIKYGITYQHTFVQVDANGNEITKWNGGEVEEFLANIE